MTQHSSWAAPADDPGMTVDQGDPSAERHRAGECEVDAHVAAGETTVHASPDDFTAHLDDLDAQ